MAPIDMQTPNTRKPPREARLLCRLTLVQSQTGLHRVVRCKPRETCLPAMAWFPQSQNLTVSLP